jgi:hypothetical protein
MGNSDVAGSAAWTGKLHELKRLKRRTYIKL